MSHFAEKNADEGRWECAAKSARPGREWGVVSVASVTVAVTVRRFRDPRACVKLLTASFSVIRGKLDASVVEWWLTIHCKAWGCTSHPLAMWFMPCGSCAR